MLQKETAFYNYLRSGSLLGPTLDTTEFSGLQAIIKACADAKWPISWTAYALATAYHETAHTMQPISEFGGNKYFTRMYDMSGNRPQMAIKNGNTSVGDGIKYRGRGYVQLTWKNNYKKAESILGITGLVSNPDLALTVDNASKIMISGMQNGWFTGRSCKTYLPEKGPATKTQFVQARRIINGLDKSDLIARYAEHFQEALLKGEWK